MVAYVIYQGEVLDPSRYDEYKAKAAESILAAGGKYVVRGGDVEVLEGEPPAGRTVVLEFPSKQAAIAWYRSDEYTEIRKIREGAARARMYVVDPNVARQLQGTTPSSARWDHLVGSESAW